MLRLLRLIPAGIVFTCAAALAQQAKAPAFEIASVKAGEPGQEAIKAGPASLTMQHVRLTALIRYAYGIQDFQITGPAWLNELWFEVNAKPAEPASERELKLMLQTLLAERFKLAIHRDKKEMSTYILTVPKNGHKLKVAEAAGNPSFKTGKMNLTGDGATIAQLTEFLSAQLREPVIDQTNLTGLYSYYLDIMPYITEETMKRSNGDNPPAEGASIIATAIQAQLGLKLDTKKAPVEMIVVDHMEKTPVEN